MKMSAQLEGLAALEKAMSDAAKQAGGAMSEKFVTMAMIQISAHTAPFVPVDTSALINSEYRKASPDAHGWTGEIGFETDYAKFVHDGGSKNWQKGGASDKFLEKGAATFVDEDLEKVVSMAFKGLGQ